MNLRFTYSSPSVYKLRGYTPEEAIAQRVEDTVTPGSIELVYLILKEELEKDRSGAPSDRERRVVLEHYHKNGDKLWLESSMSFMRDENGNINGVLGVTRDVTYRKRVEDALRDSEEKLQIIMDGIPAYLAYVDSNERYVYVNRAYAEWHNSSKDDFPGQHLEDILEPSYYLKAKPYYMRALNGERVLYENTIIDREGNEHIARAEYVPHISNGVVNGFFALLLDITERKKAEEKVLSLLNEKELLLKEVHHRIKNNMGSISSLLYLQADTLQDPAAIEAIQDARSRVISMMSIYEMLYRSEDCRSVSVFEYLTDLIEKISVTYIRSRKISIEKDIDDFRLDSSMLFPAGMIINELLTNALKYAFPDGSSGSIMIRMKKLCGKTVEISVKDSGVGLPDAVKIAKSKGFGLSLVNMLVQQLHGKLNIVKNGGTEFRITFICAEDNPKGASTSKTPQNL